MLSWLDCRSGFISWLTCSRSHAQPVQAALHSARWSFLPGHFNSLSASLWQLPLPTETIPLTTRASAATYVLMTLESWLRCERSKPTHQIAYDKHIHFGCPQLLKLKISKTGLLRPTSVPWKKKKKKETSCFFHYNLCSHSPKNTLRPTLIYHPLSLTNPSTSSSVNFTS